MIFSDDSSFLEWSVCHLFLAGLAVVHRPADTFHVELVRASACTLIFTIVRVIVFSDRVHDRTNDLFGRSKVRTPGLAA